MNSYLLSLTIASACALGTLTSAAAVKLDPSKLPPASTQSGVTYEKDIKPIMEQSCVKCHGNEKPKAKLNLTSLAGALKGGSEGPDIVPGKSGESKMMYAISYVGDEDDFMPPPKNKAKIARLTPEQVGLFRAWIDQGAK